MSNTTDNRAEEQARAQLASIVGMVATLECDHDRLEELRNERDNYVQSINGAEEYDTPEQWAIDNPDDAEELAELEATAGECESEEDAQQRIQEDPLSIEVRSGWYSPGDNPEPEEFNILLCTGGPAVRIIGELDQHNQPARPRLQYQDWGTRWTELVSIESHERDALLTYCQQFYFGE
jgi:hypothetical protein